MLYRLMEKKHEKEMIKINMHMSKTLVITHHSSSVDIHDAVWQDRKFYIENIECIWI